MNSNTAIDVACAAHISLLKNNMYSDNKIQKEVYSITSSSNMENIKHHDSQDSLSTVTMSSYGGHSTSCNRSSNSHEHQQLMSRNELTTNYMKTITPMGSSFYSSSVPQSMISPYYNTQSSASSAIVKSSSAISDLQRAFVAKMKQAKKVPKQCRKLMSPKTRITRHDKLLPHGKDGDEIGSLTSTNSSLTTITPTAMLGIAPPAYNNSNDCDENNAYLNHLTTHFGRLEVPGRNSMKLMERQESPVPPPATPPPPPPMEAPREMSSSPRPSSTVSTPSSSRVKVYKIYILLIDTPSRQFELISLNISLPDTTISDLISFIPSHSKNLGHLCYTGLCRPNDTAIPMNLSDRAFGREGRTCRIISGEILLAIPEGYTGPDVRRVFNKKLVNHPKLTKLLRTDGSKERRRKKDHNNVRGGSVTSDLTSMTSDMSSVSSVSRSPREGKVISDTESVTSSVMEPIKENTISTLPNGDVVAIVDTINTSNDDGSVFNETKSIQITTQLSKKHGFSIDDLSFRGLAVVVAMFMQRHTMKIRPSVPTTSGGGGGFGAHGVLVCWALFSFLNWYQEQNPVRNERMYLENKRREEEEEEERYAWKDALTS